MTKSLEEYTSKSKIKCQNLLESEIFKMTVLLVLAEILFVHLIQFFHADLIYSVRYFWGRGGDFIGHYNAGLMLLEGYNPYYLPNFIKPPLIGILHIPLAYLSFSDALLIYQLLTLITVCAVVVSISKIFSQTVWVTLFILLIILFSYPFEFLLDRGNVDAFSLGASYFSFLAIYNGLFPFAGLLAALSFNLKSNTLVFLPALCAGLSLKRVGWFILFFGLWSLLIYLLIPAELNTTWYYVAKYRSAWPPSPRENGSIYRLLIAFKHYRMIGHSICAVLTLCILAGLWGALRKGHFKNPVERFILFLPLCQMYPPMAYIYGYIFLPCTVLLYAHYIPLLKNNGGLNHLTAAYRVVGIALACFPSGFYSNLFVNAGEDWPFLLNSLGLLFIFIANILLTFQLSLRPSEQEVANKIL